MKSNLLQLAPVAVLVLQLLIGWVMWSMRKKFVTADDLKQCRRECDGRTADVEKRAGEIEIDLAKRLPRDGEVASLQVNIEKLRGEQKALTEAIHGLNEAINRVERPLNLLMEHHLKTTEGSKT